VLVRPSAGHHAGVRGERPGGRRAGLLEPDAPPGQPREVRGGVAAVAVEAQAVGPHRVEHDQQDVRGVPAVRRDRGERRQRPWALGAGAARARATPGRSQRRPARAGSAGPAAGRRGAVPRTGTSGGRRARTPGARRPTYAAGGRSATGSGRASPPSRPVESRRARCGRSRASRASSRPARANTARLTIGIVQTMCRFIRKKTGDGSRTTFSASVRPSSASPTTRPNQADMPNAASGPNGASAAGRSSAWRRPENRRLPARRSSWYVTIGSSMNRSSGGGGRISLRSGRLRAGCPGGAAAA